MMYLSAHKMHVFSFLSAATPRNVTKLKRTIGKESNGLTFSD